MATTKVDSETIQVVDPAPVRLVKIKDLKQQRQMLQDQKAVIQTALDAINQQILDAKNVGVE